MSKLETKTNAERRPKGAWPKLNQLLFDLGSNISKEENVKYVMKRITELDRQFDLG